MNDFKHTIEEVDDSVNEVPRNRLHNIWGMFDTVTAAPTANPTTFQNQIKIYTNGLTHRLYWYDVKNNTWHYITATA